MINKKTVFVLGAGASCPYGYPSGARLRELICLGQGFRQSYIEYLKTNPSVQAVREEKSREVDKFREIFDKSSLKSIDVFMANNPKLAPTGKYIIAYEMFRAEQQSCFRENANQLREIYSARGLSERLKTDDLLRRGTFQGGDWYFYVYNRFVEGLVGGNVLSNFSEGNLAFITFNYDRSLEQFLYEALRNSFTEVSEDDIIESLKKLKILHVYGQIAPLKWQNPNNYVDYKPQSQLSESLLLSAANNIRTIYEEKQNPELTEAQNLLAQAERVFLLGFGYAPENMEVLKLPGIISKASQFCGTAFGLESREIQDISGRIIKGLQLNSFLQINPHVIKLEKEMDCLNLLRNYF